MGLLIKNNGTFTLENEEIIYSQGQEISAVLKINKGKVNLFLSPINNLNITSDQEKIINSYRIGSLKDNQYIGLAEYVGLKQSAVSYKTEESSELEAFLLNNQNDIINLFKSEDPSSIDIIRSNCKLIANLYGNIMFFTNWNEKLSKIIFNLKTYYFASKNKLDLKLDPKGEMEDLARREFERIKAENPMHKFEFDKDFIENNKFPNIKLAQDYRNEKIDEISIKYFNKINEMNSEVVKYFMGNEPSIWSYHELKSSQAILQLIRELKIEITEFDSLMKQIYNDNENCLYSLYVNSIKDNKITTEYIEVIKAINYIIDKSDEIKKLIQNEYLYDININPDYMKNYLKQIINNVNVQEKSVDNSEKNIRDDYSSIPDEFKDCTRTIIEFSEIAKDKAEKFWINLEAFRNCADKQKVDAEMSLIRKAVTDGFFEIYELVAKKVIETDNKEKLYKLFLNYGFCDEKLISPINLINLLKISDEKTNIDGLKIYTALEWSNKIYNMEKDPSINEFELDYNDYFREMKRKKEVTDEDKPAYLKDKSRRLNFEISNMIKTNDKLTHGLITTYVPILYEDIITKELSKCIVTPKMIKDSIDRVIKIDYSCFYRDVLYKNIENGIDREYVMKEVLPDIILMPVLGTRCSMWQDISGRDRGAPGRFCIPIFTTENLDELILKLLGNFKWELCRTIMGVYWNDITERSLTSEYCDYIQFYKKNIELSNEVKEKIKHQVLKYNNLSRDIFTSDYETWINYESKGSMRLNKIVRSIFYTHVPITIEMRKALSIQPSYVEIHAKWSSLKNKEIKELQTSYKKYSKSLDLLDETLKENLRFKSGI